MVILRDSFRGRNMCSDRNNRQWNRKFLALWSRERMYISECERKGLLIKNNITRDVNTPIGPIKALVAFVKITLA